MLARWHYQNGQTLAYCEYGDQDGFPVLAQHGLIASIRDGHLFDRLIAAGRRVICIARPGYGDSSAWALANLGEWGTVVAALAAELRLPAFDVFGMSSGAPYSYAIGYHLPEQTRHIYILSGTPALCDDQILALWPFPVNRAATLPELQQLAQDLFFSQLSADDLRQPAVQDSRRNDCFGIALDLQLRCRDWGFQLTDVRTPVSMQHSRADTNVPFVTAEMTARRLPHCRFIASEHDEHFSQAVLDAFIQHVMLTPAL